MNNLRLYKKDSEYQAERGMIDRPYGAYAMDTNRKYYSPAEAAGDILAYNSETGTLSNVSLAMFKQNKDILTPEAVLVVPRTHTSDGKARYMSLVNMSVSSPENGSTATAGTTGDTSLYWGGHGDDIAGLVNYSYVNVYVQFPVSESQSFSTKDYGFVPSTSFSTTGISLDKTAKYAPTALTDNSRYCPSPYLSDDSPNPVYHKSGQALCDMNGKANTDAIIATVNPAELTSATAITALSGRSTGDYQSHAPAVLTRWFHTPHTSKGDWYLPAAGEAGYMLARLREIDQTLNWLASNGFSDRVVSLTNSLWYWTSSEYSANDARGVISGNGTVSYNGKYNLNTHTRVRAFLAL